LTDTDLMLDDPLRLPEVGTPAITPGFNLLLDWIMQQVYSAQPHVDAFRKQYEQCRRFFDGKHYTEEDKKKLSIEGRPDNAFNSAQKFIRFITGIERTAPEALLFTPVDESDQVQQQLGEFTSRCYDWAIAKGRGDYERSIAFEDLTIGGMGWMSYAIEYGRDPRGLPMTERFSPTEALFPLTDRQNLEGSRWRARESWVDIDELKARFPKCRQLINSMRGQPIAMSRPEATHPVFHEITEVKTTPVSGSNLVDPRRDKGLLLQFEWFDDEDGYYFFDPLENQDIWFNEADFNKYRRRLALLTDKKITDYIRRPSRQYKRAFILNRAEMLGDPIDLKRFHLNCMTGSYDPEDKVWYGYFRILVDPVRFSNKFFNQIIEIMGHTAKGGGGWFEKGSLEKPQVDDLRENYSKPGRWHETKPGAISGKKILPKPMGELPQASVAMMQLCVQMQDNITGMSPSNFGGGPDQNVAGATLRQKGKSSLILLSKEFDALARFRQDEGMIVLDQLESLADDRLIAVGGHADASIVKLARDPFQREYMMSLDDVERDPNMRKMYQDAVMQIAPTLIRMQMFLPELLDYMPLPFRFKQAIKGAIRSAYQARQQAAAQGVPQGGRSSPVTPQERQAKVQKSNAEAMAQLAKAKRLESQSERDKERMIMDALVKMVELNLQAKQGDRDATRAGIETAQGALDIFHQATNSGPFDPALKKPSTTKSKSKS